MEEELYRLFLLEKKKNEQLYILLTSELRKYADIVSIDTDTGVIKAIFDKYPIIFKDGDLTVSVSQKVYKKINKVITRRGG